MISVGRTAYRVAVAVLAGAILTAVPRAACADTVLLTITNEARQGAEVRFTEARLLALPQVTIRTRTRFTDGVATFVGPLARDAIAAVPRGNATKVHLVAVNDYSYDIPIEDLTDFNVVLAPQTDGVRLSRRDRGPIWLMYPLDDHPGLHDAKYNLRLVRQLTRMELR